MRESRLMCSPDVFGQNNTTNFGALNTIGLDVSTSSKPNYRWANQNILWQTLKEYLLKKQSRIPDCSSQNPYLHTLYWWNIITPRKRTTKRFFENAWKILHTWFSFTEHIRLETISRARRNKDISDVAMSFANLNVRTAIFRLKKIRFSMSSYGLLFCVTLHQHNSPGDWARELCKLFLSKCGKSCSFLV